jgi:hypothetical protein
VAFTHEAAWHPAIAQIDPLIALPDQAGDLGQRASGDHLQLRGDALVEAGQLDEAAGAFRAQLDASERASIPGRGQGDGAAQRIVRPGPRRTGAARSPDRSGARCVRRTGRGGHADRERDPPAARSPG